MPHPERFGKYVVSGVLGKGAMGAVYKAFDPDIERTVAIKTIRVDAAQGAASAEMLASRFRTEAQAAGRLSHPGIVAVYEFGRDQGCAYIAMEFIEGSTLRDYFASKTEFGEEDVVSLVVQLLEALGHAHERKVWHRDIKPANLIVMGDGRLKVADFGIARIDTSDLTQTTMMMGTPGYMPPEMYRNGVVDHRADLFAAGAVLYHLMAGRPAFHGSAEQVMYAVCNEEPAPVSSVAGRQRWGQFDPVLARALAKSPDRRYQSAAEFRDALLQAHEQTVRVGGAAAAAPAAPAAPLVPAPAPLARPQAAAPTGGGSSTGGWDPKTLAPLESQLAKVVGPLARVLVKRASQSCSDMDQLVDALANEIGNSDERTRFLQAVRNPGGRTKAGGATDGGYANTRNPFANSVGAFVNTLNPFSNTRSGATAPVPAPAPRAHGTAPGSAQGPAPSTAPGAPSTASGVAQQDIDRATQLVGTLIGPLARVVVKNAARGAASLQQFHQKVAEGIPNLADRDAFLREIGKRR